MEREACPPPLSGTADELPPYLKMTNPVGVEESDRLTVALRVTFCPYTAGFVTPFADTVAAGELLESLDELELESLELESLELLELESLELELLEFELLELELLEFELLESELLLEELLEDELEMYSVAVPLALL